MKKLALIPVIILLTLALFEQAYRISLYGSAAFSFSKMNSFNMENEAALVQKSALPGVGFEMIPNLRTYWHAKPFLTNSYGMRGPERSPGKESDVFRVVLLGDSFSVGAGVNFEEMYSTLLEENLARWGSALKYEVFNFSVPGYGLGQYLALLKERVLGFQPNLIIVGWDSFDDHVDNTPSLAFFEPAPTSCSFCRSYLWTAYKTSERRKTKPIFTSPPIEATWSAGDLTYVESAVAKLGAIVKERRIPVVVARIGMLQKMDPRAVGIFNKAGIHYVDLAAKLDQTALINNYTINILDPGPNVRAHSEFSAALFSFLVERRLIRFKEK